jgi:hypothetical protein
MPTAEEFAEQLAKLNKELDKRAAEHKRMESYYEGSCPLPKAIERAKVTKAYRMLMPMAEAPWGALVVDSVTDRLEPSGIRSPFDDGKMPSEGQRNPVDEAVWGAWQDNQMDAESKLGNNSALISGRAFALVTPTASGPEVTLDSSEQMVVQYREGSRRHRVAAMRRWQDDDSDGTLNATLYLPSAAYKFRKSKKQAEGGERFKVGADWWEPRDENWVVGNPLGVVPAVELPVNRRLKPGTFGYARGEYAHCTALIDRINMLTFLGLVVAFWQGFPIRGVIGQKIAWEFLVDDEGNPLIDTATGTQRKRARPPFDATADTVVHLEDPETRPFEFAAADRKNLSVIEELDQLATVTKTPRHYFPMPHGMSNLSADAIRASEGGMNAKVVDHKSTLGEGYEEMLRVAGLALPDPVYLSPRAELQWMDHEARSMAERADAAVKLKDILPPQVLWQKVLNLSHDEIARIESYALSPLFAALREPAGDPDLAAA